MDPFEHIPGHIRISDSGYVSPEEEHILEAQKKKKETSPSKRFIVFKDGVEVYRGTRKNISLLYGIQVDTVTRRAKSKKVSKDGLLFREIKVRSINSE